MFCKLFTRPFTREAYLEPTRTSTIVIELTQSKTILEITVEIAPQPAALDFKKLSQYSTHSK